MAEIGKNVIVEAVPDAATRSVRLTWTDGSVTLAHFDQIAGKGVFAPLTDPMFFNKVSVGPRGRTLEWPGDLEFCADALWFEAHPEANTFATKSDAAE
jgi:hypothetical protein